MPGKFIAAASAACLIATPCLAAEDIREPGHQEHRMGAFAGASFSMPFGQRTSAKPSARFQLSTVRYQQDLQSGALSYDRSRGLELTTTNLRTANFYVGGQNLGEMNERYNLDGGEGWVVPVAIGVGAAVAALLILD